jgi:integrase
MRREHRIHGPYKHGKRWRCHIPGGGPDGKTGYRTFETRAAAIRYKETATVEAQGITVSASITAFLDATRARERTELTIKAYSQLLNLLLDDYLHRPVRAVARHGATLYAAVIDGRSADSHQNLLVAGRLWARWCVRQGWLSSDPFAEVEPVGQRAHGADKARLTVDESRKLEAWCLEHADDQGAVLTLGYLYLGSRNSELVRRDVRDVDDDGRVLQIGKTKTRAGRRALAIPPLLSELLRALCSGRAGDTPIFTNTRGARMSRYIARRHVRRVCDLAKVTALPPQALRRTWSSLADAVGEAPLSIARHLGHAIPAAPKVTEQAYLHRGAVAAAQGERVLRVIRGGRA